MKMQEMVNEPVSPSPNTNGNKDSALTTQEGINQVMLQVALFRSLRLSSVASCACTSHLLCPRSVNGTCTCFRGVAVVSNAAVNTQVRGSF